MNSLLKSYQIKSMCRRIDRGANCKEGASLIKIITSKSKKNT
jgi:hypothetical protein